MVKLFSAKFGGGDENDTTIEIPGNTLDESDVIVLGSGVNSIVYAITNGNNSNYFVLDQSNVTFNDTIISNLTVNGDVNTSGSIKMANTVIIDSNKDVNVANITATGVLDVAGDVNTSGSFKMDNTVIIDSNKDVNVANIAASGRIGIGTTNPAKSLHIVNDENRQVIVQNNSTDTNAIAESYYAVDSGEGLFWGSMGITKSRGLHMNVRGIDGLNIDSNGNVGIGTRNPTAKLDVNGNIKTTQLLFRGVLGDGNTNNPHTGLTERLYNGSGGSELLIWKANDQKSPVGPDRISHIAAEHIWSIYNESVWNYNDTDPYNGTTEALRINADGNVVTNGSVLYNKNSPGESTLSFERPAFGDKWVDFVYPPGDVTNTTLLPNASLKIGHGTGYDYSISASGGMYIGGNVVTNGSVLYKKHSAGESTLSFERPAFEDDKWVDFVYPPGDVTNTTLLPNASLKIGHGTGYDYSISASGGMYIGGNVVANKNSPGESTLSFERPAFGDKWVDFVYPPGGVTNTTNLQNATLKIGHGTGYYYSISATGGIYTGGNVVANGTQLTSDDRVKSDEVFITSALDTVKKIRPQEYNKWNTIDYASDSNATSQKESGIIAQELYIDAPELRHLVILPTGSDSNAIEQTASNYESYGDLQNDPVWPEWSGDSSNANSTAYVNYTGLIPYTIGAIKELSDKLDAKDSIIASLVSRIETLEGHHA